MQPVRRRIRADPRAVLDREVIYGEPMASRIVLSANEGLGDGAFVLEPGATPRASLCARRFPSRTLDRVKAPVRSIVRASSRLAEECRDG
jgi:hypothetical protein